MRAAEEPHDRLEWLIKLDAVGDRLVSQLAASSLNGHQKLLPEAEAILRRVVA